MNTMLVILSNHDWLPVEEPLVNVANVCFITNTFGYKAGRVTLSRSTL